MPSVSHQAGSKVCSNIWRYGFVTWELFLERLLHCIYFYLNSLVAEFYLKPFMTPADGSDLERVHFEPFLSNFLPPGPCLPALLRS